MSGTNVPSPTFGATGFIAPAESAILAGRLADLNAAFGGNLNTALTTPQGQLASSDAAIIGDCNDQFLALANGVDPAFAAGRMQDGIGRIYFITRNPAQSTVLQVVCAGLVNVAIPVGALVEDEGGNQYAATEAGTIPVGGSVTLGFACTVTGPIACAAQTLTIYQAIPGWDSAVTLTAGVTGNVVESRAAFEVRRQQSVAGNALGMLPAVLGAVLSVAGVLDAYAIDNTSSFPALIGGVTLAPNSLYVAVVGGLASAVAQAIWSKKAPGCSYNGNTTVTVTDPSPLYASYQAPSYAVSFEIPTSQTVLFAVTIANSSAVPSNAAALIAAAIAAAFVGGDGGSRERIGGTIYAGRYYAPVLAVGAWVRVISILVGTGGATLNDLTLPINQEPVTSAANVSVTAM